MNQSTFRYNPLQKRVKELEDEIERLRGKLSHERKMLLDTFVHKTIGVVHFSPDGRFVRVNNMFCSILGYSEDELVEMTYLDVTHPDDHEKDKDELTKISLNQSDSYCIEKRWLSKSGAILWAELHTEAVRSETQEVQFLVGVVVDITHQKETEKALMKNKERFKLAMKANTDGLWDIDLMEKNVYFSPGWKSMLGFDDHEIDNTLEDWEALVHPDDLTAFQRMFNVRMGKTSNRFRLEYRMKGKEGDWVDVLLRGSAITNESGETIRFVGTNSDITKRKRVEKILLNERKLTRQYLEVAGIMLLAIDRDFNITLINPKGCQVLDCDCKEAIGKNWIEHFIPEENKSATEWFLKKMINNQEISHVSNEGKVIQRSGMLRLIAWKNSVLRDENGSITGIFASGEDITEKREAEIQLQISEQKYRALYNHAPLAYQSLDRDGYIIDINPAWSQILGYSREEVIGRWVGDFLHPDSLINFKNNFPKFKQRGYIHDVQFYMIKKDGTGIAVSYEGRVSYDDNGNFVQSYCTFKDITKQKAAESELLRNKQRLWVHNQIAEAFITSTGNDFFNEVLLIILKLFNAEFGYFGYTDVNGGIVRVAEFIRLKGEFKKTERATRLSQSGFLQKGDAIDNFGAYEGVFKYENYISANILNRQKILGQIFIASNEISYTEEERERIKDLCEYISPLLRATLTEERYKEELIDAKNRAEESERLKSAFLANMSHEIRTPMNGIIGFANLLREPNLTGSRQEEYIRIIENSGQRMLNIIGDLINISKIEAGQMDINTEETNVNEVIDRVLRYFLPLAEDKDLMLEARKPLSDRQVNIRTDREKLHQILTNLVENALKYTNQGKILFGYYPDNYNLVFYVEDTGIGIAPELHQSIFERFVQADLEISAQYEGAGLGLAITKAYVEMLGGKIHVKSEIGKGATFSFTLPFAKADESKSIRKNKQETAVAKRLEGATILVVEDDPVTGFYFKELLGGFSPKVVFANTGLQAVTICKQNPDIDIVLMDIKMPKMDGYTATRKIREFNSDVCIIAQTAYALKGDQEKALEAGCNGYISKPIDEKKLFKIIEAQMEVN